MSRNSDERLGTDKMFPLILRMAIPAVIAQLVNLLYSIVDKIYIGHIEGIGKDALAGVGITSTVIIIVSAFAQLVGGGGAPLASMSLGRGDKEQADKILNNSFIMLMFFAVICSTIPYVIMKPVLRFAGASETTLPYAVEYLSIYLSGTVFVMISMGLNSFITAQGNSATAMISVVIGAVLNTLLDPVFIFGFNLGVKGAAIASVISQAVSSIWILAFLCSRKTILKLNFKHMSPDFKIIGRISSIGIAPFVMASTESIIGFALNSQLYKYGGDIHVSALTVMQSAMQMLSIPITGFSQGIIPVLSYNYGHRRNDRVKTGFKISLSIIFTFNCVGSLLIIAFPKFIGGMFTDNIQLLDTVGKYMPIFMIGMTVFGLQRACQNTFVALGQAKVSLFIAMLRKIILLVPLSFILPLITKDVMGIYMAEAVSDSLAAIICISVFIVIFPKILNKTSSNEIKDIQ